MPYGDQCPQHCPSFAPADCGEGMMPCMGPTDSNGCMTRETCVPNGETCPYYCPYVPPVDCGEGMMSCLGSVDGMGCKTADSCVPYGEECPFFCPYTPATECGEGSRHCMGPTDANGCMTPDTCVPDGEECPYYCAYRTSFLSTVGKGAKSVLDLLPCLRWISKTTVRAQKPAFPMEISALSTVPISHQQTAAKE